MIKGNCEAEKQTTIQYSIVRTTMVYGSECSRALLKQEEQRSHPT